MKINTFLVIVVIILGLAVSIALTEREEFERDSNLMSNTQMEVSLADVFLELYTVKNNNQWPQSWQQLDKQLAERMGWQFAKKKQFMEAFVLLPGIPGHIETREEGPYDSTLMMISAAPIEHLIVWNKKEVGRWAIWRTFRGQIVSRWHPEKEITAFSSWSKVQKAINDHQATIKHTPQAE